MARKWLVGILWFSLAFEIGFTGAGFFAPGLLLQQFQVPVSEKTLFLGMVIAWMILFISVICGLALKWVREGNIAGWTLSYVLGFWWIGIGIALHRPENLVLDSLKGALIVLFAWRSGADARTVSRGSSS